LPSRITQGFSFFSSNDFYLLLSGDGLAQISNFEVRGEELDEADEVLR
jgi:hypothetical protein